MATYTYGCNMSISRSASIYNRPKWAHVKYKVFGGHQGNFIPNKCIHSNCFRRLNEPDWNFTWEKFGCGGEIEYKYIHEGFIYRSGSTRWFEDCGENLLISIDPHIALKLISLYIDDLHKEVTKCGWKPKVAVGGLHWSLTKIKMIYPLYLLTLILPHFLRHFPH